MAEIEWTLKARANVLEFAGQPGLTDLQRAARFLLRNRGSFVGGGDSFAVQKASAAPSPPVRAAFRGCRIKPVLTANGASNRRTHASSFAEVIIQPPVAVAAASMPAPGRLAA